MKQWEVERHVMVLNCIIARSIPFVYLGLLVGADAKKVYTWQSVIDKMRRRLTSWKKRHLPFEEMICLVKSVLSLLSLYFLSCFRVPKKVLSILHRI